MRGFAFMAAGKGACPTHANEIYAMAKSHVLFEELRRSFGVSIIYFSTFLPLGQVSKYGFRERDEPELRRGR